MGEAAAVPEGQDRFVVFAVGGRSLALPAGRVREIVRVPALQRVPHAPAALAGLMNLRGTVLPVIDLAGGSGRAQRTEAARILVVEAGAPLGLLTEGVAALATGTRDAPDASGAAGFSDGLARLADGKAAHIVALDRLLAETFPHFVRRAARRPESGAATPVSAEAPRLGLVSFEVSGQDYALPLDRVAEIITLPPSLSSLPRTDEHVLGVAPLRERLLPVVSTARLLHLPARAAGPAARIIVARVRGTLAGLLVDRVKAILQVEDRAIDRVPALLRSEGAEIQAICRLDGGRRLLSVLSTDGLFSEVVMSRIAAEHGQAPETGQDREAAAAEGEQFVLFRVAEDLYGLPIAAVQEVVRVPGTLTRLPKTPSFVEGVMNLRGAALPVIDQRRRFDLPPAENAAARRIVVLSIEGARAGFIVDGVAEVRRFPPESILPAPEMAEDQARLVPRVATLEGRAGLVLLMDPKALLDTTEKRLLAALGGYQNARPAA